jgi:uncharacterized membrane protein
MIAPEIHAHWMPFMTDWTVIAGGLYAVCLVGSILARTSAGSWWFAMPAFPIAMWGVMPTMAYLGVRHGGLDGDAFWKVILPIAFAAAILVMLPLLFQQRKLRAESHARAQREAEARELRGITQ